MDTTFTGIVCDSHRHLYNFRWGKVLNKHRDPQLGLTLNDIESVDARELVAGHEQSLTNVLPWHLKLGSTASLRNDTVDPYNMQYY